MLRDYGFVVLAIVIGLGCWALFIIAVTAVHDIIMYSQFIRPFYRFLIVDFIFLAGLPLVLLFSPIMLGALYALRGLGWVNLFAFVAMGTVFAFALSLTMPGAKNNWLDYLLWVSTWPSGALAGWVLFRLVAK